MSSNRLQIMQGFRNLIAGVNDPATSQPLFQAVQLGVFFAPQVYTSWAEITFSEAKSTPIGSGGTLVGWRIEDYMTIGITSGWDYQADAALAMAGMLNAMDILLPILHSHVIIPSPNNPAQGIASVFSVLTELPERALPVRLPNKNVYLLWHVYVMVKQQYNVTIANP